MTITTRDTQHCEELVAALEARGYPVEARSTRRSAGS
jgi:hypothetical protein